MTTMPGHGVAVRLVVEAVVADASDADAVRGAADRECALEDAVRLAPLSRVSAAVDACGDALKRIRIVDGSRGPPGTL
jgi:hypothetical protein